jgi:stage III sporulation protein AE
MKRILFILFFLLVFIFSAAAESKEYEYSGSESSIITEEQIESIEDATPDDVSEFLYEAGVDMSNPFSLSNITAKGAVGAVWDFIAGKIKAPFVSFVAAFCAIVLCSLFESLGESGIKQTLTFVGSLSVASTVAVPIVSVIKQTAFAITACGGFMTALIPVFAGILIACAKSGTAAGLNSVLFFASQLISQIGKAVVLPLCSVFFSLSIASGVSNEGRLSGFITTLKKTIVWLLGGMTFVFVAILSLQTVIGSIGDTALSKTAKFLIGSFVPIIGSSISEALGAVVTSLGVLKAGVGIYAVVVLLCISVPLILEILIWKLCLNLSCSVASLFGLNSIRSLIFSVNETLTVMLSLLICVAVLFIISVTIVNMAGASV